MIQIPRVTQVVVPIDRLTVVKFKRRELAPEDPPVTEWWMALSPRKTYLFTGTKGP